MYNHNKYKCVKKGNPLDPATYLSCPSYSTCEELELNLFRQKENGELELYYPLKKIVKGVANYLSISTKDLIERLKEKHGLSIGRTTILKYHKMGLLDLKEKIGMGRAKGVVSFWKNSTILKAFFINLLKDKGIKLAEFKKYQDIAQIKRPKELKKYAGGPFKVMAEEDLKTRVDIMKFYTVVGYLAAVELKISKPSNYNAKIKIDEKNLNNSKIEVTLIKEAPHKKVIFSQSGTSVLG